MKKNKNTKRILAVLLVVCCLFAAVTDFWVPEVQAVASEMTPSDGAQAADGNHTEEVKSTEQVDSTEKVETESTETVETETTETQVVDDSEEVPETAPMMLGIDALGESGGRDMTNETSELKIQTEGFQVFDKNNKTLSVTSSTAGSVTTYDATAHSYYNIGGVNFNMNFEIVKAHDAGRTIKEGDYFTYPIPAGFDLSASIESGEIKSGNLLLARYEKVKEGENVFLKVVFSENINAEKNFDNIKGGLNLKLDFDSEDAKEKDKTVRIFQAQTNGGGGIALKLPEVPTTVKGIAKEGTYNTDDNTITWDIKIGTDAMSMGVSLKGLTVEDTIGEDQSYIENTAQLVTAAGAAVSGSLAVKEKEVDGKKVIACEIIGDIAAPATLQMKTGITQEAMAAALGKTGEKTAQFNNTAEMKIADGGNISVEGDGKTNATVDVTFGVALAKQGQQIDSNTIRWTIRVNNVEKKVRFYKGIVTDTLTDGLTYKTGTMKYTVDGKEIIPVESSSNPKETWAANQLYVSGQTMIFSLAKDTKSAYEIVFDTTVSDGFVGTSETLDGQTQEVVKNAASIQVQYPHWGSGPYPAPEYGIPEISTNFNSSMIEKSVTADATTGILTWTIRPSTRTDVYEKAVITDEILEDQELKTDSVMVTKGGEDSNLIGNGEITNEIDGKKLTITIPKSTKSPLGDYTITYQTNALNFFRENSVEHEYKNTAKLEIKTGDASNGEVSASASAKLKNDFLKKDTKVEYIDNEPYFHYSITVNGNDMSLTKVKLEDNLSLCKFTYGTDKTPIASSYWTFDTDKGRVNGAAAPDKITYDTENQKATISLGTISSKQEIHLYAKLTEEGKKLLTGVLKNQPIYSENTVSGISDEVRPNAGTDELFSVVSAGKDTPIQNNLVTKKILESDAAKGSITWQVILNPNGGPLPAGTSICDVLSKNAKYDTENAKLYHANILLDGKFEKGAAVADTEAEFSFTVDKEKRYMTVTLKNDSSNAYILEYSTPIVDTTVNAVTNGITLKKEGEEPYGTGNAELSLSGGNWGTLSSAGKLEITKYDGSVEAKMPLANAEFTVYSDADCNDPVDVGETGANGKIIFSGLEVGTGTDGKKFYVKETKTPEHYKENNTIYEVTISRGKTTKLDVSNIRKTDSSSNVNIKKEFIYSYQAVTTSFLQSEFELYFYPYGKGGVDKESKKVSLKRMEDGKYQYTTDGDTAKVATLKNNNTDGTIFIENLPWGYYGLKETKPAAGFAAYSDMRYFEIATDFSVSYDFSENQGQPRITNQSTSLYVKKYKTGTTDYLAGVKLQICKSDNGILTVVANPMTNEAYEWTTSSAEASQGHKVENLPEGSYVLHEVADETDATWKIAEDISFSVDKYGKLKIGNKEQADSTITMYNSKISLKVSKVDQFDEPVMGAEITVTGPSTTAETGYNEHKVTGGADLVFEEFIRGGTYQVTETVTPQDYKQAEPITVYVDDTGKVFIGKGQDRTEVGTSLKMVDRKLLIPIRITKEDSYSNQRLENAEFSLYKKEDESTPLYAGIHTAKNAEDKILWEMEELPDTVQNTDTGKAMNKGLRPGDYYLEETKTPEGFKKAARIEFTITQEGILEIKEGAPAELEADGVTIVVKDEPLTLRIEKRDRESNTELAGAVYKVTGTFAGETGDRAIDISTDAKIQNNVLSGKLVPEKVYKLEEVKAPLGYQLAEPVYFKLDATGNVTITDQSGTILTTRTDVIAENPADDVSGTDGVLTILDEKITVAFEKKDASDLSKRIDGAVFTIQGIFADKNEPSEKILYPTAENAAVLEGMLIEGNEYTLTEEAPTGYIPLTGTVKFTYKTGVGLELDQGSDSHAKVYNPQAETGIPTLEIANDSAQNTSLQFLKYDAVDNSGIPGTEFELTFVPESGGLGHKITYTIPEAGTKYTYVTAGEEHQKITAEGEGFFPDLERGTYTLTEKKSAYAYELGEGFSCSFIVDDNAKNKTIVINETNVKMQAYGLGITKGSQFLTGKGITNERRLGTVTLEKVDKLDQSIKLSGVEFTIYRYRETDSIVDWFRQIFTGKSYEFATKGWTEANDADGKLTIQGLPWGRYYIAETKALENYVLDETKYEFTIGKDNPTQVLDWSPGKKITNGKVQMTISNLTHTDASIKGTKMRLYGRFANESAAYIEWTVGDEPYIIAGELVEGESYSLEQASSYDGYVSAQTVVFEYYASGIRMLSGPPDFEFTFAEDGSIRLVQKVAPILVSILKVNEDGQALAGAKLVLEHVLSDTATQKVEEWTSTADAKSFEGKLLAGENYILRELSAPAGYQLASDISFTVTATAEEQNISMTDKLAPASTETESESETQNETDTADSDNGANEQNTNSNVQDASTSNTGNHKMLPKTGREQRNGYYVAGAFFIVLGSFLCRRKYIPKRGRKCKKQC